MSVRMVMLIVAAAYVFFSVAYLALWLLVGWALYRRRIFLKV